MSTLGGLLIKKAMLTPDQLVRAKTEQQQQGGPLVISLVRLGLVKDEDLLMCLHSEYRLPILDLQSIEPSPEVLRLIPPALAQKHHVLPISRNGSILTLAVSDPSHLAAFNEIKFLSGCDVKVVLAHTAAIEKAIQKHYSRSAKAYEEVLAKLEVEKPSELDIDLDELHRASEDAPVVKLVSTLMSDAIGKRASDIHIEPYEDGLRVRFRIDGVLHEIMQPPMQLKAAIASRIKVMASLDIAERRLPQDGVIKIKASGTKEINFRVSVLPTVFGEKVVLRLLAKGSLQLDLDKIGMDELAYRHFKKAIAEPSGMVLVTGPTGSGKTTTLYSALATLTNPSATSPRWKIPWRSICAASIRWPSATASASPSPRLYVRSSGRTQTCSWSARSATSRPSKSPSKRRSPAIWCSPRCTPTMPPRPSGACSTWESIPFWWPPR